MRHAREFFEEQRHQTCKDLKTPVLLASFQSALDLFDCCTRELKVEVTRSKASRECAFDEYIRDAVARGADTQIDQERHVLVHPDWPRSDNGLYCLNGMAKKQFGVRGSRIAEHMRRTYDEKIALMRAQPFATIIHCDDGKAPEGAIVSYRFLREKGTHADSGFMSPQMFVRFCEEQQGIHAQRPLVFSGADFNNCPVLTVMQLAGASMFGTYIPDAEGPPIHPEKSDELNDATEIIGAVMQEPGIESLELRTRWKIGVMIDCCGMKPFVVHSLEDDGKNCLMRQLMRGDDTVISTYDYVVKR